MSKTGEFCSTHYLIEERLDETKSDLKDLHSDLNWIKGLLSILITAVLGVNIL
jgi:hypothetical protein